jgi:hypothetical protein
VKDGSPALGPFRARTGCVTASHITAGTAESHYAAPILSSGGSRQPVAEEPEDFQSAFRRQLAARSDSQDTPDQLQKPASRGAAECSVESAREQQKTQTSTGQQTQDRGKEQATGDQPPAQTSAQQPTNGGKKGSKGVQHDDDSSERLVENAQGAISELCPSAGFEPSAIVQVQTETDNEQEGPAKSKLDSGSNVSSTPAEAVKGDLALALRITPSDQSSTESTTTDSEAQTPQQSLESSTLRNQLQPTAPNVTRLREADPAPIIQPAAAAAPIDTKSPAENAHSASAEQVAKGSPQGFEAEFNKSLNEPVKSAHVQISGAENQRVDIRLQERGGALAVTVRSADTKLAQSLQDHAPELNSRLTAENFHSELWTPNAGKTANERQGNNGNGQATEDHGNSGQGNPNQNQNGRKQPEWIELVEAHTQAFQKRTEYRWHQ